MKTLNLTRAWILICSIIVVSSATKHPSSQHDGSLHHGEDASLKSHQNTIDPHGIRIPERIMSTQNVSCISVDDNIFEIMNEAQNTCKGNDLRCTFYHLVNEDYQKLGTTDVNKQLFDDLLTNFDNWLLTVEKIEKDDEKIEEEASVDTVSGNRNDGFSNNGHSTANASSHTNHGIYIDKDHDTNEIDNGKVHTHHLKKPHEPHHSKDTSTHGDKLKNGEYITKDAEYNKDHKYFEVFLPKDREKGKPRTIYVEIDKDKNEFVLVDEAIDDKLRLHNDKAFQIELDELSEIADTAFNDIVKSSNDTEHNDNDLDDDEMAMVNDISTNSSGHEDKTNSDADLEEITQNNLDPTILIPEDTTVVPNKYIKQAPSNVESQLDNPTDATPIHFDLLESIDNETDTKQTDFKDIPLDTLEFHDNNNSTDLDLHDVEYSYRENELTTEHENVIVDDDSIIQLVENNDTENDFSSSDTQHEHFLEIAKPFQDNKLTPTTDPTSIISDYKGSQLDPIPSQNPSEHTVLRNIPPVPSSTYTTVPILGKDLAKVLETDSQLQSSFPAYAILDNPSNSDLEHPSVTSYNSKIDSDVGHSSTTPNISQFEDLKLPYPPIEYVTRLKESKYLPANVGFSLLPSYSRIEELRQPSVTNSLPIEDASFPQDSLVPSKEFPGSPESHLTVQIEDQNVPSFEVQETSLPTTPFNVDDDTVLVPKDTSLTLLLPNTSNRIATTSQLRENPLSVTPCSFKTALNSPASIQEIPQLLPYFPTKDNLRIIKQLPPDTNFGEASPIIDKKETTIPCTPYRNTYPTFPYTVNPYLKPPYLGPLLPVTPSRPVSKIPSSNSLPSSLDQTCSCINGDYVQNVQPVSLPPTYTPFSTLNPLILRPGYFPNTLYPNLWNNIPYNTLPYSPYTVIPYQDIRKYQPALIDSLSPGNLLEDRPCPLKSVPLSYLEQPCSGYKISEMTPLKYIPYSPVNTASIQMESNPSLALEHDLQVLSLKYGIPLTKILKNLAAEVSDAKAFQTPFELLRAKNLNEHSPTTYGPALENRIENEELVSESDLTDIIPLDSSLIGPHLNMEGISSILDSNDSQIDTVSSKTTVKESSRHPSFDDQVTILDSSLIGPHLATFASSNSIFNEENLTEKEIALESEAESSLKLLDSSLIGPHLELGSLPEILDLNKLQSKGFSIQPKGTLITSTTEVESDLQNQSSISFLDSSLTDTDISTLSVVKPLLNSEIVSINEMLPESAFTELSSSDSPELDFVNEFEDSETVEYTKPAKTLSPVIKLHEADEFLLSNLEETELDSSSPIPLDSSLIGPHLYMGSSIITINDTEYNPLPVISEGTLLNTDIEVEESESIILPPSLLPTLLDTQATPDLNLNILTQDTKFIEQNDKISLDTNEELSLKDMSIKTPLTSMKETDFEILEQIPDLSSIGNEVSHSSEESATSQHTIMSSETSDLNNVTELDSSLTGPSLLDIMQAQDISTSLDSSSKGPSLYHEVEVQETTTVSDSTTDLESSFVTTNRHKPFSVLDAKSQLDTSLKSQSLQNVKESVEISHAEDTKIQLESSLIGPDLTSIALLGDEINIINEELQQESFTHLDSSLGSSLNFESRIKEAENSQYHNSELSVSNPVVIETTDFAPFDLEDHQFFIDKSQLSLSEIKSSESLSSKDKISSNYMHSNPSTYTVWNPDLQTLTSKTPLSLQDQRLISEFGPTTPYFREQELSTTDTVVIDHPYTESNYILTPKSLAETLSYAQGFPLTSVTPYSPYVQRNPLMHRWLVPQLLNLQNILQAPSGLRPMFNVAPCYSNALESKAYTELFNPKINTPETLILSPIELASLANALPLNKYDSSLPKKSINPSLGSNPIILDDITSLLDEDSFQLLKGMSVSPLIQSSSTAPEFEKGLAPSLLRTTPTLNTDYTKTNSIVPSPIYNPQIGFYEPQNIPYTILTPNIPSSNSQPYPNAPLKPQFSEKIGPPPELVSLPVECPKTCAESQLHEIPQLIDSVTDPFDSEFLQQPCLGSVTVIPSSSLDTKLQVPYQLPPIFFTPLSTIPTTPLPNAFTCPIPSPYARPTSVSYARPKSASPIGLPSNVPYLANPFIPSTLPLYSYPTSPIIPDFTSQLTPIKTTPSDYPYPPKPVQYRPIPSAVPCKPSATYSSPCSLIPYNPFLFGKNPCTAKKMTEYLPEYGQQKSKPICRTIPTSLTLESPAYSNPLTPASTSPMVSMPFDVLSPYVSTIPLIEPMIRPSNPPPAYLNPISPVCSSLPLNKRPMSPNPTYDLNLQLTASELQLLKLLKTPSFPNTVNPLLQAYQKPKPKRIPLQSYSQTKQDTPCVETIESNLQTTPLTEEIPYFDDPEEIVCTYSDDRDEEPYFKCPLESLSCTLEPEDIAEDLTEEDLLEEEDFLEQEDFVPCTPCDLAMEPMLQSVPYQEPDLTPYTRLHGESLRPYPTAQLPPPYIIDPIQPNIFENLPEIPLLRPLKVSPAIPPSILYSPVLRPLSPSILPILPNPCTDISLNPYNISPMTKKPLLPSPYYSAPIQDISPLPIDPKRLRNYISPQITSDFFEISSASNCMAVPVPCPMSKPATQLPTVPYVPGNYILIPPTLKTSPCQSSLRPSLTPLYDQYVTPLELPITAPSLKKMKPHISSTNIPPILPIECSPLNEIPPQYQPCIPLLTALTCPANNVFKAPPVATPYTVLPSLNNIVQPSRNLNSPQWLPCIPEYSLSASNPTVPLSNVPYSEPTSHIAKQPITNHIIPSSLFYIPDTDSTLTNKSSPPCHIPGHSLPSLALSESLERIPCYTPSRPLEKTVPTQAILKPISHPGQHSIPLSLLPYLSQPVQPHAYPIQAVPTVPCPTQSQLHSSPIPSQYVTPCSTISYSSSPLQKQPYHQVHEPIVPQYSLSYDPSIHSPPSARNPFIKPDFKPVTKVPSYPVPNDCISTPLNSIILSNILQPLDIFPKSPNPYSSPMTSSVPLPTPSLMPIAKPLPQKSRQFQPYVNSDPQLTSTNLLQQSPLLKPLLGTCQNIAPLLLMDCSALKPIIPEKYSSSAPINNQFISLPDSLVSVLTDAPESKNPSSQYSSLRPLNKQYKSPVPTPTHTPLYSNYNILKSSPKPTKKAIIPKPIEVSAMSASDPSQLSIEETVPYDFIPSLMDRLSPLPIRYSQQRPCIPILKPLYLSKPLSHTTSPLQHKFSETETVPLLTTSALLSNDEAKLIDDSHFVPVSPIHSKPLTPSYSPAIITPLCTDTSSKLPSYSTLKNTGFPSPAHKQPPLTIQPTPRPQSLPIYMTPQEYEELTQCPSNSYTSPSPPVFTPLITRPFPSPHIPSHPNLKPQNWLQSPIFTKSLPFLEKPIEVTPEKENLQILLNKYKPFDKMTPLQVNHNHYGPESSVSKVLLKLDPVIQTAPINPLFKLEPYTEYTGDSNSNDHVPDSVRFTKNKPDISKAIPFTKNLPEIKGFIPYNNKILPRPHRLSKLDHFYENNLIGARPQVFTLPSPNTPPLSTKTDVPNQSTTAFPDISKPFTNLPTKHFEPYLDTSSLRPNEVLPDIQNSPIENPGKAISRPKNYLNPYLESNPQFKYPLSTMELPKSPPILHPYNNIKDLKYSGYKTYQIPAFKSPQIIRNLGVPPLVYPSITTQYSVPLNHQVSGIPNFDTPTEFPNPQYQILRTTPHQTKPNLNTLPEGAEFFEPQIPYYQTPIQRTPLHQTKPDLNTPQEDSELNEDNTLIEIPISIDNVNEDNELKTSLINYINKKESIKDYKNEEITIPLGNIAIIKKEPNNADIIQTNNPSIGLKVWKSNLKLAQAELKLKFKDLSVNNFMPIVNNLNKYDIEEIRKIVKNYIDQKYGNHIEVNEPYIIDNKYTIIEDFDHNASDNKYNLLWPTNYV